MNKQLERYVVGCMTGTSLDGIDAVLTRIKGTGLEMQPEYVGMVSQGLGDLAGVLAEMTANKPHTPLDFLRAARQLGEVYANAVADVCEKCLPSGVKLDFVVCHGQTIWHAPADCVGKLSWQLFDPWPVVRKCQTAVCYDLRQADLIAGGEGAPITPSSDWFIYRQPNTHMHIINMGGICNITTLPASGERGEITGGDRGPSNLLIDGVVSRLFKGKSYDKGGELASQGRVTDWLWDQLEADAFGLQSEDKITLGREDFDPVFFEKLMSMWPSDFSDCDKVAAATEAVAHVVVDSVLASDKGVKQNCGIVLAGGGAKNTYLVNRIKTLAGSDYSVCTSDELGVPVDAREAMGFAILGAMSADGISMSLPQITKSSKPGLAGAWAYP